MSRHHRASQRESGITDSISETRIRVARAHVRDFDKRASKLLINRCVDLPRETSEVTALDAGVDLVERLDVA
jgi:hypothetical protein